MFGSFLCMHIAHNSTKLFAYITTMSWSESQTLSMMMIMMLKTNLIMIIILSIMILIILVIILSIMIIILDDDHDAEDDVHDDHGYPAYSHHDKNPPWWEFVSNE